MHVYNRAVPSNLGPLGLARIRATRLQTLVQALHPDLRWEKFGTTFCRRVLYLSGFSCPQERSDVFCAV